MKHPALGRGVRQATRLREQIERMALQRWLYEGLDKKNKKMSKKDQKAAAMAHFAYYEWYVADENGGAAAFAHFFGDAASNAICHTLAARCSARADLARTRTACFGPSC